jgi:hypothetical protein
VRQQRPSRSPVHLNSSLLHIDHQCYAHSHQEDRSSASFLSTALQPGLELRTHLSRTHGAEIEAAPVPGLAWPGCWLSKFPSGGGAISQLGASWGSWRQTGACLLANGCACAERVRSEFGALGEPGGEWKRPKAANYHQWAGSPALGFFLLVSGHWLAHRQLQAVLFHQAVPTSMAHQAVSSAQPQPQRGGRGPVPII